MRNEASNEIRDQYLDATKARTLLGWTPAFEFDAERCARRWTGTRRYFGG